MEQIGLLCKEIIKNINMKQLLSLFLFLLPCLAWAQYPSNGNQKITLGEQTTADGLIWRGVAADTTLTAKSDTAAYFVLDTVNINLYTYKASATGRKWRQLGADTAAIAYVNTYGTQTVNGEKTFTSAVTGTRFNPTSSSATGTGMYLPSGNTLGFSTNGTKKLEINSRGDIGMSRSPQNWGIGNSLDIGSVPFSFHNSNSIGNMISYNLYYNGGFKRAITGETLNYIIDIEGHKFSADASGNANTVFTPTERMRITSAGNVGIGTASPTEKLHVAGNARITAMNGINDIGADANGVLQAATSDMNLKNTIENSPFGLKEILLLNPVTFLYNDTNRKIDSDVKEVGFIAQDVFDIIPNAVSSTGTSDLQLDYRAITATLVKAIQEQQAQIEALKQRLLILENK